MLLMLVLVPDWTRTSVAEADNPVDGVVDARDTSMRDQLLPRLLPGLLPAIPVVVCLRK
jgi:hypothetical protein